MSLNKTIIGFAGLKQSGKSTAAEHLVDNGFTKLSFAQPIKDIAWFLMRGFGLPTHYVDQLLTEHKEVIIPELGVSSRHLMQTLGTEWGRQLIHPDIWVMSMSKRLVGEPDDLIVFDDIRFENEAKMIRDMGGLIIHVDRGDLIASDIHISESGIKDHESDRYVDNDFSIEDFLIDVDLVVAEFMAA